MPRKRPATTPTPADDWISAHELAVAARQRLERQDYKLVAVEVDGETVWRAGDGAKQPPQASAGANEAAGDVGGLLERLAASVERVAAAVEQQSASVVAAIMPEGLSKRDAAKFLGVTQETIEQLLRTRKLAFIQHGEQRGRAIAVEDLRAFLQAHRQPTGEELMRKRSSRSG